MKYAELFSGIGVGSLAFKEVFKDAKCAFFSEILGQRIKIYKEHFPDHENVGNIDFVEIDKLPNFDILIGGSPCQDLSIARGKREGLDGDQSGLFYKYLDVLREKKPKYFILENVASMSKEDRDEISRCLKVQPVEISSAYFTGQDRKRLYWCNFPLLPTPQIKVDPRRIIDQNDIPNDAGLINPKLLHSITIEGKKVNKTAFRARKSDWDFIGWSRSTRYKKFLIEGNSFEEWVVENPDIKYKVMSHEDGYVHISYVEQRIKVNMDANTLVTGKHCARMSAKNFVRHKGKARMINRKECLRLQGLPDNYLDGMSESAAYSAIGDSFTFNVIVHILKSLKVVIENEQSN